MRNLGFDQIAFELLTAQGSNSISDPDFSGATNYLLALWDERGIQPTTEVCRVLLGHRAQCAQCHRDKQGDMQQDQFWQLTAFFRQTQISSHGAGRYRLTDRDFDGDLVDGQRQPGAVSYQQLDGSWRFVSATLPDGRTVDTSGALQDASRRRELASWLVASPAFSRAGQSALVAVLPLRIHVAHRRYGPPQPGGTPGVIERPGRCPGGQ